MNRAEAARVLGVDPGSGPDGIRRAFRARIGRRHPDRAGVEATTDAVRIIEAYTLLRREAPPAPAPSQPPPTTPSAPPVRVGLVDTDTVALDLPADEAFLALLDAGNELGEITYVDPDLGLLEVVVQFEADPTCSLVITTQGRADRTDAFCTIESLEHRPAPAVADVVALLAARLAARAQDRPPPA